MYLDLFSAYGATAAKAASWAVVSAMLYRLGGAEAFAMFALLRSTIGILNYSSLGLAPALIHRLNAGTSGGGRVDSRAPGSTLDYQAVQEAGAAGRRIYSSALAIALATGVAGLALAGAYGLAFDRLHRVPLSLAPMMSGVVWAMGAGTIVRIVSDVSGALLQARDRIAQDNVLLIGSEILWVALCVGAVLASRPVDGPYLLACVSLAYAAAGVLLLLARNWRAGRLSGLYVPDWSLVSANVAKSLLGFGLLVWIARLADFLYAPTDYILINRFLSPQTVAVYAPAVQIDAALLLLVGGLSAVLLPKSALAHAAGDTAAVSRYYRRGTLAAVGLLTAAAAAVWLSGPLIFRVWFGNALPRTQAILPLLLIHTVVGGSSAPGGAILIATGRVRPYTISVLIAGAGNVILSYLFAVQFQMGLPGIILGTIAAVVGRCGIWMPWYVSRTILRADPASIPSPDAPGKG